MYTIICRLRFRNKYLLFSQCSVKFTVPLQALHGALNNTMDTKMFLLMVAACVWGSYNNSSELPEPYQGNLETAVKKEINERAYHLEHGYEEIITGKIHSIYNITF